MIAKELINPQKTALLVIDIQVDYCSDTGEIANQLNLDLSPVQKILSRLTEFVNKARETGLPIVFTQMIEDPKYMAKNAQLKKGTRAVCSPDTEGFKYYKIKPEKTDYQIVKKTYDAFSNPELEKILKKHEIENVLIVGAYTAVCVDTTIRSAFTRGYNIVVPQDLVGMPLERKYQHDAAIDVWKIIFAHVVNSEEIMALWEKK